MKLVINYIFILFMLLFPYILNAQPNNPPETPIDGGIGFLLAAGIAYGITKFRKNKKM